MLRASISASLSVTTRYCSPDVVRPPVVAQDKLAGLPRAGFYALALIVEVPHLLVIRRLFSTHDVLVTPACTSSAPAGRLARGSALGLHDGTFTCW